MDTKFHSDKNFKGVIEAIKKKYNVEFDLFPFRDENREYLIDSSQEGIVLGHFNEETNTIHFNEKFGVLIAIDTILHELHHKTQLESGRLKIENDRLLFDGKEYEIGQYNYHESPWELEANAMSKEMFQQILDDLSNEELAFLFDSMTGDLL